MYILWIKKTNQYKINFNWKSSNIYKKYKLNLDLNNQVNMSTFLLDYFNSKMDNLKEIFQLILSTNLGQTIKLVGFLAKNTFMISVDITQIYFGQFNLVRYIMCWVHFFMLLISLMFFIPLITFD